MARRRRGSTRVYGPRAHRRRFRIMVVERGSKPDYYSYATAKEARQVKRSLERGFGQREDPTVKFALDRYEVYLRSDKGDKAKSVYCTTHCLRSFFLDREAYLSDLDGETCQRYYDELTQKKSRLGKPLAVDTHRNILSQTRSFLTWCVKKKKWLDENPLAEVEGKGKRRHGKAQLRVTECRLWLKKAVELAETGDVGAVAAMMTLLLGMRASEIISRVVRDVDDDGRLLWIPASKTPAGRRTLEVPGLLVPYLAKLAEGRPAQDSLFGCHWRDWPRKQVARICSEAKVMRVTAHGMRGAHATLATERGITGHVVAAALGHESCSTTYQSYAKPESVATAQQQRVLTVLEGGRR